MILFRRIGVVVVCGLLSCGSLPAVAQDGAPATPVIAPADLSACTPGAQNVALITVSGFRDRKGNVRAELYPDNDDDFLAPGSKLRAAGKSFARLDIATPAEGPARICLKLPHAGHYAMAILHDRNADGRLDPFSDGFGFPNNPKMGFGKPKAAEVSFTAPDDMVELAIRLNYWQGLNVGPWPTK